MVDALFQPCSSFAGLLRDYGTTGEGVRVVDRDGVVLASILALRSPPSAIGDILRQGFNIELPVGPRRVQSGRLALLGVGPGRWLATAEPGDADFVGQLAKALGQNAAVFDQSSGYGVLQLTGPRLCDALAKGVTVDFHPDVFRVGDVAVTSIAHIGATLWRLDDADDGAPVMQIAVSRSLAGSFWLWLASSSAEFGLVAEDGHQLSGRK